MQVSTTGSQMVKLGDFQGYDENGLPRSLNGRLVDAHEVLCSTASASAPAPASGAAGIACMIPTHRKIGQGMRLHFGKMLNEYGKNDPIPGYLENDTPNFYLNREVKSEETQRVSDAEQCFEKESQQCACKSNDNSESRCSSHW